MISESNRTIFVHPECTGGSSVQSALDWTNPEQERERLRRSDHHATWGQYYAAFHHLFTEEGYSLLMTVRDPYTRCQSMLTYLRGQGMPDITLEGMLTLNKPRPIWTYLQGLPDSYQYKVDLIRMEHLQADLDEWAGRKDAQLKPLPHLRKRTTEHAPLTPHEEGLIGYIYSRDFEILSDLYQPRP